MKKHSIHLLAAFVMTLAPALALAAAPNTYQVTGPVLELKDDLIVVQKGKEKWELARTPDTKIKGELKVGSKVTIEYRMTATTVEVKGTAAEKPARATSPTPATTTPKAPAAPAPN
jgi:hypothetical protein